ncbi:hypothetical protein [Prosthecobacter sp.]|uniref:hypothetical protein n=1 Tax=Prosthecobacter sp. TaxID=1965333 RepID=UPI002AB938D6|nr:hypothetical protein [Prosthecobacter sp.]MDZ4404477.1 hypothetical protein [Prosthecobacter sp.]
MHRHFVFCFLLFHFCCHARADLPVPPQVLDPQTAAEAWNVIRLSTGNVARLLKEDRLQEAPQQISLCSPALRLLARASTAPEHRQLIDQNTALAFRLVNDIAQAGMAQTQATATASFARLQATLDELKPAFDPADVNAEIHVCPQHPERLSTKSDATCPVCGGVLRVRRIPYTDVNPTPVTSLTKLSLESEAVLTQGVETRLRTRLQTIAGPPLASHQLVSLHGAPVRFLLVDQTLQDFHLLTPTGMDSPGIFEFAFTPAVAGPYRLWAEIAPAETALPEYPATDLGGEFKIVSRATRDFLDVVSTTVGGFRFDLTFTGGNGGSPPLRQVSLMRIHVSDSSGQPVTRLEPFMSAFAHLTGFYDDGKTVLRLHPVGGDILREDLRGGPWLAFKIRPPQVGFIRFFCQVRVDGRVITAPLGVNIVR